MLISKRLSLSLHWICEEIPSSCISLSVLKHFLHSLFWKVWSPQRNDLTWPAFRYLSSIVSLIHSYVEPGSAWSLQRNDLTWPAFRYLSYIISLIHSSVEQKTGLGLRGVLKEMTWPGQLLILVLHCFPYSVFCRAKTLPGSAWSPQRNDLTWPAFWLLSYIVSLIQYSVEQKPCLGLRGVLKEMTWPGQRFDSCLTSFPLFSNL